MKRVLWLVTRSYVASFICLILLWVSSFPWPVRLTVHHRTHIGGRYCSTRGFGGLNALPLLVLHDPPALNAPGAPSAQGKQDECHARSERLGNGLRFAVEEIVHDGHVD